ncbi:MAG: hypothetical protein HQL30_11625 [Candidatus Omnitrophica bacterium]|nr:hypothetical protein [Candidatus Omnitrophota bacterium]
MGTGKRMREARAILIGVIGVLIMGGAAQVFAADVDSNTRLRSVSGIITAIDVKLGKVAIDSDAGEKTRGITEYKINLNETRVTDPTDTKFLVIKDLMVGQHVTIELISSAPGDQEETMARKIIADPMPMPLYQVANGQVRAIDGVAGTLLIEETPLPGQGAQGSMTTFHFDPKSLVVMKSPSMESVQLVLKPGDTVKVEYALRDGLKRASSVTLLSAVPGTTSTTTTTSTTVTR